MKIYGVAVLAACYLAGQLLGDALGVLLGMDGNVGGVGFAMLLLILLGDPLRRKGWLVQDSELGVLFWSAMYIPVVVAMSSVQNVKAALSGGWVALLAGGLGSLLCIALVPMVARAFSSTRKGAATQNP